jgi:TRAP transporter 4TM/12TM fusion protein
MWVRLTPERSALIAIVVLLVLIMIQELIRGGRRERGLARGIWQGVPRGLWQGIVLIVEGLEKGARNMITIAIATAAAGIVVGMVTMTNLGYGLTQIIQVFSGGNIWAVLVLAAITSLILGMGLPTTANYIVMAALVAPIIAHIAAASGMTVPLVAVHLFVFYFGILADDTPPVGIAAFAASAISGADPIRTGIQGFIYDLRTAILPFMFFFNPTLLLIGVESWLLESWTLLTALIGMLAFVAATQGWLLRRMTWPERAVLLAGALLLIKPGWMTDLIGLGLALACVAWQYWRRPPRLAAGTAG